ncbi:unnamed protein product [Ostreobium quekettii]|uniref:Uncharacterized protein n=1 Tax=Ostreobium quekettii TaxID=121088 RepID=A0A8S1IX74_9CHLO|nr:unnamed protein product [Ostreobium quekettii]
MLLPRCGGFWSREASHPASPGVGGTAPRTSAALVAAGAVAAAWQRDAGGTEAAEEAIQKVHRSLNKHCEPAGAQQLRDAVCSIENEVSSLRWRQPLTSDHAGDFLAKLSEVHGHGLGACVEEDVCFDILDCLHADATFQGALGNGGKLLASGVVAAAYAISVPSSRVALLSILPSLSDLASHPGDVIRAQAEAVVKSVLRLSNQN